jgi:acetyl esterase/lipase
MVVGMPTSHTPQSSTPAAPVLEAAALAFAEATARPPHLFDLSVSDGRKTVDQAQDGDFPDPAATRQDLTIAGGPTGDIQIAIYRPAGETGVLPVVVYIHGAGWVFGDVHTHDRLVRELTTHAEAATIFVSYALSPEAHYPTAIEQIYAVVEWNRLQRRRSRPGPQPDRGDRRLGRRQHGCSSHDPGQAERRPADRRATAVLPGHERGL